MLVFLKLGGSLITDKTKPYTAKIDIIERIAKEIKKALKEKKDIKIIVGHGGGSFPHVSAKKYKTHKGFINEDSKYGFCVVQNDASKLNRIVVGTFLNEGLNVISIQPSAGALAEDGKIVRWDIKNIEMLLENDIIPIVYGDVCLDTKKGCCIISTEEIFRYLAEKLKPEKVILVGRHIVYNKDPSKFEDAIPIKEINRDIIKEIESSLGESNGYDVTGGMLSKVKLALEIAKYCKEVEIVSGLEEGNVKKSLLGENIGTVVRY